MKTKIINQKKLSAECWHVQVWGKEACKECQYRNTKECGGRQILSTGKNDKGHAVPLPDMRRNHESE